MGALAAAIVADDVTAGRRWFRRALLPTRTTTNLIAEVGDRSAEHTVLVLAHHDSAHAGLVFHPQLPRSVFRRFPSLLERSNTAPPVLWGAVLGPLLVAAGALLGRRPARLAGSALSAAYTTAMVDIGLRRVVAGANDNATGVAVLVSLASWLGRERLDGVRVLLVSTGSEESLLEGMQGFARRHFAELPPERTHVVVIETVGSPHLLLLEGEGMLAMHEYPKPFLDLIQSCAEGLGIFLWRGLRFHNATDGLIALKAGYPTAMIGSVDRFKVPTEYHWRTDTADRVNLGTVADAARLTQAVIRRLAASRAA